MQNCTTVGLRSSLSQSSLLEESFFIERKQAYRNGNNRVRNVTRSTRRLVSSHWTTGLSRTRWGQGSPRESNAKEVYRE
jgi:hypothetical protein